MNFKEHYQNKPELKGSPAAPKEYFGDWKRYAIAPIHTRFDAVTWFVWDAEHKDCNKANRFRAVIIGQHESLEKALEQVNGLNHVC